MDTQALAENIKLLDTDLIHVHGFYELLIRILINFISIIIIVRFIYYPINKRKDFLFTYILISTVVFLICILLGSVKLQLGFALGLFAVFRIIRYRTTPIPIKEMAYLFVTIGISVINALSSKRISYVELLFANVIIVGVIYGLEKINFLKHESCKLVNYEKIELIKQEKHSELIADLQDRTGLKINRIEIGKIDFLRDTALISVYYYTDENQVNLTDEQVKFKDDSDDD